MIADTGPLSGIEARRIAAVVTGIKHAIAHGLIGYTLIVARKPKTAPRPAASSYKEPAGVPAGNAPPSGRPSTSTGGGEPGHMRASPS